MKQKIHFIWVAAVLLAFVACGQNEGLSVAAQL